MLVGKGSSYGFAGEGAWIVLGIAQVSILPTGPEIVILTIKKTKSV
jgi:hypothetical protein